MAQRYGPALLAYMRSLTRDAAQAADLTQEALLVTILRLRREPLHEPAKIAAFLAATARNLLIAEKRKAARRATETGVEVEVAAPDDILATLLEAERREALLDAIHSLRNDRDREILLRFDLGEESRADVAAALGLDPLHFNRVLHRARQRLKEILKSRLR
ncbi:MAG TPA: sigma-70 family RNA polymerase sigma factor [Thermoanaerobaculia bacterium]|nr:sigma-70 family RNA polymerase sigma factor [Thermoanaerobaculia bacterium]